MPPPRLVVDLRSDPRSSADPLYDVAVVGAGIAGCAAALGLAHVGLRTALVGPEVRVHEPSADAPFDPRIYALAPASIEMLSRLRVWDRIDATRVQDVARIRVFGDSGGSLSFDAWSQAVSRLAVIVEEREPLRVLDAACRFGAVERIDASLDGVEFRQDDVRLRLAGGRSLSARLVVGADGSRSAVRAAAGIPAQQHPYGQTALVSNFAIERPHRGVAWQWFTPDGIIALLPLPGDFVSLVWSAPDALVPALAALAPEDFARRVGAVSAASHGRLRPAGGVHRFPLQRIDVEPLVRPRLALVGDAAHVIHPLAGQGLNLGLQDVSELLQALGPEARAARDPGDPRVLQRYARRRAEPIRGMRVVTDGLARMFATEDATWRRLRNAGMRLVDRSGPLKRALVRRALG